MAYPLTNNNDGGKDQPSSWDGMFMTNEVRRFVVLEPFLLSNYLGGNGWGEERANSNLYSNSFINIYFRRIKIKNQSHLIR